MKRIDRPVEAIIKKGWPSHIERDSKTYTTRQVIDFWIVQTRWWAKEEKRIYFRLWTDEGTIEVYRSGDSLWVLSKLLD